ncbi:hypothetical protein KCM76_22190 [Zooshikella marina]|uniref:secretion/conjugation apparatus DotM-related subunit n=1 Tax=Zooshikella ganghwensis TaxID=202772 RepID=UPI001BAFAB37|nr:hypothetical protein [Zooshikella ganghwensis]MBU2708719.1 hypothetical protein [Zooshikella ganghwensis]
MAKPRKDEMALVYLTFLAVTIGFFLYLWYENRTYISYYALKWAWLQLSVFDWDFMPLFVKDWQHQIAAMARNPSGVTFGSLLDVLNKVGYFFIWIPVLFALKAVKQTLNHPAERTRREITVDTLPHIMAKHSPAVIPALYYGNLLNEDPEDQRSSVSPDDYAKKHKLIENGYLNKDRARSQLVKDLGRKVHSFDQLYDYEKALFAVFASRIFIENMADKKEFAIAQKLLDKLNYSCHKGTYKGKKGYPILNLVFGDFKRYSSKEEAKAWLARHPYPRTLLHAMHKEALTRGKLPSSHFRWLKGIDRELWYSLNTTGRKTPFIESAAVFTQTLWEEFAYKNGFTIGQPYVEDAVNGLEKYLAKVGLVRLTGENH